MDTFTEVQHPSDPAYAIKRQRLMKEYLSMNEAQLRQSIRHMMQQPAPRDESGGVTKNFLNDLRMSPTIPDAMKGVLDSTAGGPLIRQDLEVPAYVLFVKTFPFWERIEKLPSNGLVHAATQITAPDSNALGSSIITELGTVTYSASSMQRATYPVAVFAVGRGVGLKELAAVRQGGAPYDPSRIELADGAIRLASDIQYTLFQGNATNSSGTGSQEAGLYNANGFDGLRGMLGSVGSFSSNNAIQIDVSSLNITESLQTAATKAANNGGRPSAVILSLNAKQALDIEQQGNKRYTDDTIEVIPGLSCNKLTYAYGELVIIPVPGNMNGTYNRTSDNALVEDMYVLDESTVKARWLYSDSLTTLQIPSGVDGVLSERWILFSMTGLEQAAPLFNAKVRKQAA
jgi:cytochrome c556